MKATAHLVSLALLLLAGLTAAAQGTRLTGKVTDPNGEPIIGAGVMSMEKKSAGTVTDMEGNFSFMLPDGTKSVLFSSVGMKDIVYRIADGNTTGVKIVMEWESTQLDQVVVTGFSFCKVLSRKSAGTAIFDGVSADLRDKYIIFVQN